MLSGCAMTPFDDLFMFRGKYHVQGTEGYNAALEWLRGCQDGRQYLESNPSPHVITISDEGDVFVYPNKGYGYYQFFKKTGHATSLMDDFLFTYIPSIVYDGWKEHERLKNVELANAEKRRLSEVQSAIQNPRPIKFKELMGLDGHSDIRPMLQNAGYLPTVFGNAETYNIKFSLSEWRNGLAKEIHKGVHPLHGFHFASISVYRGSGFLRNVSMQDNHFEVAPGNAYEQRLKQHLDTIKAALHTDQEPVFRENTTSDHRLFRSWEWREFPTADGDLLDIILNASSHKSAWGFGILILNAKDRQKAAEKEKQKWDAIKSSLAEKRTRDTENRKLEEPTYALYNTIKNNLVVLKSGRNVGSGFLVQTNHGVYLYTNEHVVRGGDKPKALRLDGTEVPLGGFEIAKGRDLVRFKVALENTGLIHKESDLNLGVPITVFGNSDGAGVATALNGKIIGIGPSMLEISAEFVRGNSGSPVLTLDGGVVGIATFAVNAKDKTDWVKQDTRFNGVRRFAVRIDNVEWKSMDWELYSTIVDR